ncbi:MAG: S8 family serine peptidase [Lachnospiraceae bacterium]|nr:S8 family serine peptidase [Lachnospiraceae bacterium]
MKILAIIDDGISKETITNLKFNLSCENGILQEESDEISCFSHGSICAAIVRRYAPQAEIGSIRILSKDGWGTLEDLIAALNWCIVNKIKLINLSIGSIQACDVPILYETVNKVAESGGIIIAACKNGHNVSFPASFANTIGVRADKSLIGPRFTVSQNPNGGIEFSASAFHEVNLSPMIESFKVSNFNSYAAPVISAVTYNLLSSASCGDSLEELRTELYRKAGSLNNTCYLKTIQYFRNQNISDVYPAAVFLGNESNVLMRVIAEKFLNDNYLPLLFSQSADDCSTECFYLDDIDSLNNRCNEMAEFYGADLILAAVNNNEIGDLKSDVIIISDMKIDERPGNVYIYSEGADITDLYNQLMAILETDDDAERI